MMWALAFRLVSAELSNTTMFFKHFLVQVHATLLTDLLSKCAYTHEAMYRHMS